MQASFDWNWVLAFAGGLLMWGTQVGPKQVVSHAAEWAETFGVKNPPNWLKSENSDRVLRHVGALLLLWAIGSLALNYIDLGTMPRGPKIVVGLGAALLVGGLIWNLVAGLDTKTSVGPIRPPNVVLLPAEGRLLLENKDSQVIQLWGSSLDDEVPALETQARLIPIAHHYYFLTNKLEERAKSLIGQNGEKLLPFHAYIADASGKRFTAKFGLLVSIKNGAMTIHTQQLGISEGGWEPKKSESLNLSPRNMARVELANLREDGVALRNAVQNVLDAPAWPRDAEKWMDRTIEAIRKIDEADAQWFKILDAVPSPRIPCNPNASRPLQKTYREHDFRLARLEKLIHRYAERAS